MTRNLKTLTAALVAVAAFGALVASGAQAAKFTAPGAAAGETTTLSSTLDGTAKNGHQVFDIKDPVSGTTLSITCPEAKLTNAHIVGPESTGITATIDFTGNATEKCKFNGQPVDISSGACEFLFTSDGSIHILDDGVQPAGMHCMHTETPIIYTDPVNHCTIEIGTQTLPAGSFQYTNIKPGATEEVTIETKVGGITGIEFNATGAGCNYGTSKAGAGTGTYTTGNTIITGERKSAMVNLKWDV